MVDRLKYPEKYRANLVREAESRRTERAKAWIRWFQDWDDVCASYHGAFREGASGTVLGGIILSQQKLLKKIPRPMSDEPDRPRSSGGGA